MDLTTILVVIVGIIIAGALIYFLPKKLISWFGMEIGEEGCFIATAAYGTPAAKEIGILREFRDDKLYQSPIGKNLVNIYYRTSPPFANFIAKHDFLRAIVRKILIKPVIEIIKNSRR